jgi:hypothetical protein
MSWKKGLLMHTEYHQVLVSINVLGGGAHFWTRRRMFARNIFSDALESRTSGKIRIRG